MDEDGCPVVEKHVLVDALTIIDVEIDHDEPSVVQWGTPREGVGARRAQQQTHIIAKTANRCKIRSVDRVENAWRLRAQLEHHLVGRERDWGEIDRVPIPISLPTGAI